MDLLADPGHSLFAFVLCIPRILVALLVMPFLGPDVISTLARASIAVSLALFLFPASFAQFPAEALGAAQVLIIIAKEMVLGLFIGYLFGALYWGLESVGHLIDTHRGATLAGALFQGFGEERSPLAVFLGQVFTVLFFVGGGSAVFLASLYQSFMSWPIFSFYPSLDMASAGFFIDQLETVVYLGVFLAGPAVIAMFLAEMGLAITNRFVPQMQVFFLALPIKSAIAVAILALYTATLVHFLDDRMAQVGTVVTDLLSLPL